MSDSDGSGVAADERAARRARLSMEYITSENLDRAKGEVCIQLSAADPTHDYHVLGLDAGVRLTAAALQITDFDICDFEQYKRLASILYVSENISELVLNPRPFAVEPSYDAVLANIDLLKGITSAPSDGDTAVLVEVGPCTTPNSTPLSYPCPSQV
jgi:hypothetical protein